jgi:hypothetical protein
MQMGLYLETSQPCGKSLRIGFGCHVHPELLSLIFFFARLF